ncbi:MAG: FGGY-family carbohydrate kinase, partial [Lachnospiraceae bacterium]|nr:FGGY-family carbohydrate kinase [Lachnospiraceae bacterium]
MDSTRADLTQAVLEGVAFGMRDSLEAAKKLGVDVKTSMICGGGAKSPLWKKIMANVLNIELTIPETEQGPGYGGAILAAVACGEFASTAEAVEKLVHVTETVKPDPEIAARYEKKYQAFRTLYPALKNCFPTL